LAGCAKPGSALTCGLPTTFAGRVEGSYGGGSFLGVVVVELDLERTIEWVMCSNGEVEMLENDDKRESGLGIPCGSGLGMLRGSDDFSMAIQSGSSVEAQGFDGRLGFRIVFSEGWLGFLGVTVDRAILPFSSHHFCRSVLASGRPASIGP
jgi:hypothetical protein